MKPDSNRLIEIFSQAQARSSPAERELYLAEACQGQPELRAQVEALLGASDRAGDFLGTTAKLQPPNTGAEGPGAVIDRYKLLQEIGQGGCGVVYLAEQEEPVRRRVALKVIKLGMDTREVVARFEAERQALAMMDHPNIAKVHDAGTTATGRPYFVMELVRGTRITDYCDQHQLPTAERLKLFLQVCHAIQHAHQKGIVHRDIKPSNILVGLHDDVPVPKVIDFGIAKAIEQRLTDKTVFTRFEQVIGTPAYMSPEQAGLSGLDIDTRSDIYALGVLLYELLTGRPPLDPRQLAAAGLEEILRRIREDEPPKPSTRLSALQRDELTTTAQRRQTAPPKLIHQVRGDLDWIVMKCLEKNRARRYETANALASDVEHHLREEPVVARPPSEFYRLGKWVRRNKLAVSAAAVVAAALVLGLGFSIWSYFQERAARRQANAEAARSQQVAQFLQDMLKGVGPSVAQGRDTRLLREILDKTAERVGRDLTNQPEVEAKLCGTLGTVYFDLGDYARAEAMRRRALTLWQSQRSDDDPALINALEDVGEVLWKQNKLAEADSFEGMVLSARRKRLGTSHPDVALSLHNIAVLRMSMGKSAEAESLEREALKIRSNLPGEKDRSVAESLQTLGLILRELGRLDEAEQCSRRAVALRTKALGETHPFTLSALNSLAVLLGDEGNHAEAEALLRQVLGARKKVLGNDHPNTAVAMHNLSGVLQIQGKLAEAESLERDALVIHRKALGSSHPNVATLVDNLGMILFAEGRLEEAEKTQREALETRRTALGSEHPQVAISLQHLAAVLLKAGRADEAEPLLREGLRIRQSRLGSEHPDIAASLRALALVLCARTNFAEAETCARDALALCDRKRLEDWQAFDLRCILGTCLLAQKKYAEAEPLLLAGYEGLRQRENKIPADSRSRLKEAVARLVELYEVTNRPQPAADWKRKLDELRTGTPKAQ